MAASADVSTRLQPWLERMRLTGQSDVVTLEPRDFRVLHGLLVELVQERDALANWQLAVALALGYVNQAEGQSGYEVAPAEVVVRSLRKFGP